MVDVNLPVNPTSKRFHALDGARAAAMLLGVFYHLPIAMMGGMGFMMGMGATSPKTSIDNWLHSFRMPLFFMISGIFAAMMMQKYGIGKYMRRRWWRIGAPLAVAFLALVGLRIAQTHVRWMAPPNMMQLAGGFGANAGMGMFGAGGQPVMTPPNAAQPFGPQSQMEQSNAQPAFPSPPAPPATGNMPSFDFSAFGGFPQLPGMPSHKLAEEFFGKNARHLNLEHLWFLWYLLIFVTVGPLVAWLGRLLFTRVAPRFWAKLGTGIYRMHLAPLMLGLVSLPALLHAKGFMGWSLANPVGFSASFPDFLFQFGHADLPYYFIWFMTGWWLFGHNTDFARMGQSWRWNLLLGIAGFAASQALYRHYGAPAASGPFAMFAMFGGAPETGGWHRIAGFALYGLGSACTAFGLLGLFERYFNRPSRAGRYFTDAMLWVYLAHLPLIPYLLPWIEANRSPWWAGTLAGMVLVTGVSLILYELIIRTTPLVHIFGPPQKSRRKEVVQQEAPQPEVAMSTEAKAVQN